MDVDRIARVGNREGLRRAQGGARRRTCMSLIGSAAMAAS